MSRTTCAAVGCTSAQFVLRVASSLQEYPDTNDWWLFHYNTSVFVCIVLWRDSRASLGLTAADRKWWSPDEVTALLSEAFAETFGCRIFNQASRQRCVLIIQSRYISFDFSWPLCADRSVAQLCFSFQALRGFQSRGGVTEGSRGRRQLSL